MINLDGKTALVTGGAQGIGKAICKALAEVGCNIAIVDINPEIAEETCVELRAMGVKAERFSANVADSSQTAAVFDAVEATIGPVDIMVNNAGTGGPSLVYEMGDEEWHRVMNLNLNGTFYYCREAVKRMIPRKWGRVINVASVAAKRISILGSGAYSASKSGVLGLTRHLAFEVARFGITVNAICPGETVTALIAKGGFSEIQEERIRNNPSGRLCAVEDHAYVARFLASDEAAMVTGQAWDIDGGGSLGWMPIDQYLEYRKGK